jgi:hypothetical protein
LINKNVRDPVLNRALRIRGKDGVVRFQDPETGKFVKNPLSSEQIAKTRREGFEDVVELEVKTEIFKKEAEGSLELTPQLTAGSGDDFVRAGLLLEGKAGVEVEAALSKDGLKLGAGGAATAELSYASGQITGDLGKASFDVGSKAEAKGEVALQGQLGGPLGVQADLSARGKLEAVALQFQGSAETAEVDLLFGLVQVKAKAEGEFNVLGVGIQGEASVQTLKTKPGIRVRVGAGATALIGGKVKGTVEVSFNKEKIVDTFNQAIDSVKNIDTDQLIDQASGFIENLDFTPFD